jgi:hypothetical protein
MRKLAGIVICLAFLFGCDGTGDKPPGPPPPGEAKQSIEEILAKVPPEQRENVRKTLEENQRKYGGSYDKAMGQQGKK